MLNSKGAGSRLSRAISRVSSTRRTITINNNKNPKPQNASTSRIILPSLTQQGGSYLLQSMNYSTERIIDYKSGTTSNDQYRPKTLYRAENETENCGVGLVASLKSVPSRRVVEQADEMLVRMSHRGGCGCDPASGDGAGEFHIVEVTIWQFLLDQQFQL